jgi:HEAT repeat protein
MILPLLKHGDPEVRLAAVTALRYVCSNPKESIPALADALDDEDAPADNKRASVSFTAAFSISVFRTDARNAVPSLVKVVESKKDLNLRRRCIATLGEIGCEGKTVIPLLVKQLKDPEVRHVATRALGGFGEEARDAIPDLMTAHAADDYPKAFVSPDSPTPRQSVQTAVLLSLAKMGRHSEPYVPLILSTLSRGQEAEFSVGRRRGDRRPRGAGRALCPRPDRDAQRQPVE